MGWGLRGFRSATESLERALRATGWPKVGSRMLPCPKAMIASRRSQSISAPSCLHTRLCCKKNVVRCVFKDEELQRIPRVLVFAKHPCDLRQDFGTFESSRTACPCGAVCNLPLTPHLCRPSPQLACHAETVAAPLGQMGQLCVSLNVPNPGHIQNLRAGAAVGLSCLALRLVGAGVPRPLSLSDAVGRRLLPGLWA